MTKIVSRQFSSFEPNIVRTKNTPNENAEKYRNEHNYIYKCKSDTNMFSLWRRRNTCLAALCL